MLGEVTGWDRRPCWAKLLVVTAALLGERFFLALGRKSHLVRQMALLGIEWGLARHRGALLGIESIILVVLQN